MAAASVLAAALLLAPPTLAAAETKAARAAGESTEKAQQEARNAIPYDELSAEARKKVDAVLAGVTIFRRLPTQVVRCDPDLYAYLITHPEVTINLWHVLGISNCNVKRTSDTTFAADDGQGTRGDLEFLHSTSDTQVVYAVGTYEGSLFSQPVKGGCLLLLKTGYIREPDGYYYITSRMDAFLRVDHLGAELVSKAFQPAVARSVDHNFTEAMKFLGVVSRVAEVRPGQLFELSKKLDKVGEEERAKFRQIVRNISEKYEGRLAARASADDETPPELPRGTIPPPKLRR
jgi:hypothetical protein